MSDDATDDEIAALEARLAALKRKKQPTTDQRVTADNDSDVSDVQQISGNRNNILKHITVAAGGTLIVGDAPLPPNAATIEHALGVYLTTLLNQYRLLSFQGLSSSAQRRHAQIALQAVFMNLTTNVQTAELQPLVERFSGLRTVRSRNSDTANDAPFDINQLSADARQWLVELLSDDEYAALQTGKYTNLKLARLAEPRTALELVRHGRATVLTGDPGGGKTTVLRYLALSLAFARLHADQSDVRFDLPWRGNVPIPVLVQLRRFADGLEREPLGAEDLLRHVEQVISAQHVPALAGYLTQQLDAGNVLVLLDGFDEIADARKRRWVVQAIEAFQARFAASRIVVTSRIYAYVPPFQLNDHFQVAQIQPLAVEEQGSFIGRWYRAAMPDGAEAQSRSADLISAIEQRPRLRDIAQNPLLLTLMTLLHFGEAATLPDQRAELYEKCLILLLDEWEVLRVGTTMAQAVGITLTKSDLLPLIQPIAYELQQCGREEASLPEVQRWVLERFCNLTDGNAHEAKTLIERFLDVVETRSGILIARDVRDRYALPHRTFQEYLAMRELITQNVVKRDVLAHRHNPTWREVLLLLVGHLVRYGNTALAKELISDLLDADLAGSVAYYRTVALAGEMIEELGRTLDRHGRLLKHDVVTELAALVAGGHLSATERVDAAWTLGRLGDPRILTPDQPDYWCSCAAGPFWFGDDRKGKLTQVVLDYDFNIGRYPVTNAEYARFLNAPDYADPRWWTPYARERFKDLITVQPRAWNDARFNQSTQPVVGVSWYEAMAYCAWVTEQLGRTVRLPTALEWERAARHTDQRRYPWGAEPVPTSEHANYADTGVGRPAPVGCLPRGVAVCGAFDMLGNVGEWLATAEADHANPIPLTDCEPSATVLRSYSDYTDSTDVLVCGARGRSNPSVRVNDLGFRVISPSR